MLQRAWYALEVKGIDPERRRIVGLATTPEVDRMGDIVEPLGVEYTNPLPLLWQHQHDLPVGLATFKKPTEAGIEFAAELASIEEPGELKNLLDRAWQSIKANLVRGVSIGFTALESAFMENGGRRFIRSEVIELSLVTVAANASAKISSIKSLDVYCPRRPVESVRLLDVKAAPPKAGKGGSVRLILPR